MWGSLQALLPSGLVTVEVGGGRKNSDFGICFPVGLLLLLLLLISLRLDVEGICFRAILP